MTGRAGRTSPGTVLVAWLCSDIVSLFGTSLSSLAVPWMVLTLTHNAAVTGMVSAIQLGMLVLANLLSGPIIDALGPTRISVACDTISACFIALIPLLWLVHRFSIPALIVIVAVAGAMRGPSNSAKSTLSPRVASYARQPMERITGLSGTTDRLAATVGSAVGGIIVGAVGGAYALAFTSLGLILGASLIGLIVRPALLADCAQSPQRNGTDSPRPAATDTAARSTAGTAADTMAQEPEAGRAPEATRNRAEDHGHGPGTSRRNGASRYCRDLVAGWKALKALPVVLALTLIPSVTNMIDVAWSDVLTPAWVMAQHHSSQSLGLLFAAFSLPALAASIAATALATKLPRFPVLVIGYLVAGAPRYIAMALNAPIPVLLIVLAVGGLGMGFLNPIIGAVVYERIPDETRGRVVSLMGAIAWGLMPLGSLLGGLGTHLIGLNLTLGISGALYLGVTMLPLFIPSWRDIGRPQSGSLPTHEHQAA